ncbi:hypothetical protein SEA_XKCD426_35 [Streptomyces phage Xkcd426]|nr:hypothetical protein SEA_XKCD426_35 [Streptomyces phage Xkcd426]
MTTPNDSSLNVAAELAKLRGEMTTGFAEIKGQLGHIAQAQDTTARAVDDLEQRVTALEARRIPWPVVAAASGAVSAIVAGAAYLAGQ